MFSKLKHWSGGKGKRLAALMLAASLFCGIAGCSKEQAESPVNGNGVVSNSEDVSISNFESDTTNALETTGEFDWDKALSEFYINGIKMEYPFSENSLGADFKFDDDPIYNEFGDYLTIVVDHKDCKGLWLFEARYKGVTKETYNPDLVPDRIYSLYHPSVQGIKEKTSIEDVYATWGEPDESEEGKHYDSDVYYGKEEGQKLYIYYDKTTNKVELIEIDFNDMKG